MGTQWRAPRVRYAETTGSPPPYVKTTSYRGISGGKDPPDFGRTRSRVAGASTSQNATRFGDASESGTEPSSNSSNTPTPLALTIRVGGFRAAQAPRQRASPVGRINHNRRPRWVFHVAMLLPVISIGLVERSLMPAVVKCANHAAVIRGCSVPISGNETGTKESDAALNRLLPRVPSRAASGTAATAMSRSSSKRCAQVCGANRS